MEPAVHEYEAKLEALKLPHHYLAGAAGRFVLALVIPAGGLGGLVELELLHPTTARSVRPKVAARMYLHIFILVSFHSNAGLSCTLNTVAHLI